MPADPTFIELVVKSLKATARHDQDDETAPTVILWIDPDREWESILPLLRNRLPILTWGPLEKDERSGPAIWIRCMLARVMPDRIAPNTVPILYIPGIVLELLTKSEDRIKELEPLAELTFSGNFWKCTKGAFWSVDQFFQDKDEGLGLEMRVDDFTRRAMLRALPFLCDLKLSQLKAEEPWKSKDFEELMMLDNVEKKIQRGEHSQLEFKSTCHWDMIAGLKNPGLEQEIQKAIAGLLNSERGGTLLVGVENNGNVCGIEMDLQTFGPEHQSVDFYEQHLMQILLNAYGKEFAAYLHPTFHPVDGKTVCQIVVDPSPEPIVIPYLFADKKIKEETFFLRVGNATNPLNLKAVVKYVKLRWTVKK